MHFVRAVTATNPHLVGHIGLVRPRPPKQHLLPGGPADPIGVGYYRGDAAK